MKYIGTHFYVLQMYQQDSQKPNTDLEAEATRDRVLEADQQHLLERKEHSPQTDPTPSVPRKSKPVSVPISANDASNIPSANGSLWVLHGSKPYLPLSPATQL